MNETQSGPKPNLSTALRLYWHHLIGVAIFAPVTLTTNLWLHVPSALFITFFAVSTYAMWPFLTRRAPFSFWIVACFVFLGGGLLASLIIHLTRPA